MSRAIRTAAVLLLGAAALTGCIAPGTTGPETTTETGAEMSENPTIEELRADAKRVLGALHEIVPGATEKEEFFARIDALAPASCGSSGTLRLAPALEGGGIEDPEAFILEAERILAELGIPSTPEDRNGVLDEDAYVGAGLPDGRMVAIQAGPERTMVQYETVCSNDESLRDALDQARDAALETGDDAPQSAPKPSRWGIHS
ncbi:hypothetical protein [Zhihengliuella sp.]|nr:hypothetical protein [Zhihengliuella sp.]